MDAVARRVALRFSAEWHTTEEIARQIDATAEALDGAKYVQNKFGNWFYRYGTGNRWMTTPIAGGRSNQLHAKAVPVGKGLVVFDKKRPSTK